MIINFFSTNAANQNSNENGCSNIAKAFGLGGAACASWGATFMCLIAVYLDKSNCNSKRIGTLLTLGVLSLALTGCARSELSTGMSNMGRRP